MIVKDESEVIVRTLQTLCDRVPLDYWVICDTGSTDTTEETIRDFFKKRNIPGELFHTPWRDFGHNRTVALQHAYKKTDYVFVWDADDDICGDFVMPTDISGDVYSFTFGDENGLRYNRRLMFNNHKKWKYEGVLHEYAVCVEKTDEVQYVKGNYYFVSGRTGNRNKDPNKLLNDAKVLKKAYYESLKKKEWIRGRYAFYCANSYFNSGHYEDAILFYKKTLESDTWNQEKYVSCLRIFEAYEFLKQTTMGLEYLEKSFEYSKTRIECVYRLVKHFCCMKLAEKAYTYYMRIQNYYETKYLADDISTHLFAYKVEYEYFLPYFMIIVSERMKKHDIGVKMYEILFSKRQFTPSEWYMNCLFYNLQYFVDAIPYDNLSFLNGMISYINGLYQTKQIRLSEQNCKTITKILSRFSPCLTSYNTSFSPPLPSSPVHILFTITTCKRLDLFEKTMNSVLHCWKDLNRIDSFVCVDDNSSEEDRNRMKSLYPFFEFVWKDDQKGHKQSMNILWNILQERRPTYWIHLEDDWMFFKQDTYVQKSIECLETYQSQNIHQVLFNRHYAETFEEWCMNGGEPLQDSRFVAHSKVSGIKGLNCGYWPHYSFRPSMVRAQAILELGNYDSVHTFFEYEYAKKYDVKGYRSAFWNEITCLHIGKLSTSSNGINAYVLNNVQQLDRRNTLYYLFYSDEDISQFLHPNIIPIQLQPSTILLDSQGFLNIHTIPTIQNIGFLTPSLFQKTHIKHIDELFQISVEPNTVYGFVFNYEHCISDSIKCHGENFKPIWNYLVETMGYPEFREKDFLNCYCNIWLAERSIVQEFIPWMQRASQILLSAPNSIQSLLNSDALYKQIPPETLLEKIGYPHYTFHSFVLERLIGLFALVKQHRLLNTNPRKTQNGRYLFSCAEHAFQGKQYDEAIQYYTQALETETPNEEKYLSCLRVFEIHELKKQPEKGLEYLERSYEYDKRCLECTFRLIKYYCSIKQSETAYKYYERQSSYYDSPEGRIVPSSTSKVEYDFYLPYYMIIVSERLKKQKLGCKMYKHIFETQQTSVGEWYLNCLFHNLRFFSSTIPDNPFEFVNSMTKYINWIFQEKKYRLTEPSLNTVSAILHNSMAFLTEPCLFKPILVERPNILFTMTSTGVFSKMDKTFQSILRCWSDLYLVHGFVCVVEPTSESEKEQMLSVFPQFSYVWKSDKESGMANSMNIVWNILQEKRPTYWIHVEDNWVFFHQEAYISKSVTFLEQTESENIHQVLFNRHYAESLHDWSMNGGEFHESGFVIHSKLAGIKGMNCGAWPHYSIRPSVVRTSTILSLGTFQTEHAFSEYEYATRYVSKGFRSAFWNSISCLQIERQHPSGINAYALRSLPHFENRDIVYYLFYSDEDISLFQHPNIIPIQLQPGTLLFESQGYLNIGLIPDVKTIGFITPSLFYKTHIKHIDELFQYSFQPTTIYGFVFNYEQCIADAKKNHGPIFQTLWEHMVEELGYHDYSQKDFLNCYCNMWVAESSIVKEFLKLVQSANTILSSAPLHIQSLLHSDSQYKGKILPSALLEKFGYPHYTFHTFLLERLIGFFGMVKSYTLVNLHPKQRRNSFLSDPNRLLDFNQKNTFIINLVSRKDRKDTMTRLFQGIPNVQFYDAVDGNGIEYTQEIQNMFEGNDFGNRKGFIGCALSHWKLWKQLLDSEYSYYVIFEDDVTTIEQFRERVVTHRKYVETNLSQIDMYFLGHSVKPQHESMKYGKQSSNICVSLDKEKYIGGFFSYILTRTGAQKLVEYIEQNGIKHGIDYLVKLVPDLRSFSAKPHVFFSDCAFSKDSSVDSDIQKSIVAFPSSGVKRGNIRIKMLCNWCDSETLCKEWNKFSKGNFSWNELQITWENDDIDFYVILNRPQKGAFFIPERTILFQLEPWCGNSDQTWGVKTWGEWADVYKNSTKSNFLHVHSHRTHCNVAFWQINKTYSQLMDLVCTKETRLSTIVSTVCSSKYFDPGHKKRIDFLKFLETKSDIAIHIYNEDNKHEFRSYVGKARPNVDKGKGILPYKYYFMCENNSERNFITEKLWEPILAESLCFYWGCPNVSEFVDPLAYVSLDMDDFEGSYKTIVSAIQSNLWEERLPILRKEKKRILKSYSFFPLLETIVHTDVYEQVYRKYFSSVSVSVSSIRTICFIHSCTIRDTTCLDTLVSSLQTSGLMNLLDKVVIVNIGSNVDASLYTDPKILLIPFSSNIRFYELPTLRLLHRFCQDYSDANVLYLHTKGVSYLPTDPKYPHIQDWIQYMLHCVVRNSTMCIEKLVEYDVVGCNQLDLPHPHFSGNFWWSRTKYIRTLSTQSLTDKLSAEWWILSASTKRVYTIHNSNINHFHEPYPLEKYKHIVHNKILLTYTYYPSQSANYNLRIFLTSVCESDTMDYIFVVNGRVCEVNLDTVSKFRNVRIVRRANKGFDFGGHRAALDSIRYEEYAYFFFLNSSVAGPIRISKEGSWTHEFTKKIDSRVKLVGTTIVCLPESDAGGFGPKVEGFFFVTDQIGLKCMLEQKTIFMDHPDKRSAIVHGEYGISRCIFANGYTIDCMLQRYQGIDWTDTSNWRMNENKHPSRNGSYFHTSINPYEVIFHKWFWKGEETVNVDIVKAAFPTIPLP